MFERDALFVGGKWHGGSRDRILTVVNPVTEEIIGRVPESTDVDVDLAVTSARAAFDEGPWARMPVAERVAHVEKLAVELESRSAEFLELNLAQTGFPVAGVAGEALIPTGLLILREYLRAAADLPTEALRTGPYGSSTIFREPIGVAVGIAPWNGPFAHNILKLIPPLVMGCSVILKPAPETPLDSFLLAECVAAAGIPRGVVSVLPGGAAVGERLVGHPATDKVSLTGSTIAGRRVASACGEQLKRCTLELGGKSAGIVFADADIDVTIPALIAGGYGLAGQQCYALSRVLVERSRYDEVVRAFAAAVDALVVGDPADRATEIGPLIARRQRERVEGYIEAGLNDGAAVATRGDTPLPDRGWYVRPTVFRDVRNDMRIAQEEIFGPVVSVIPFDGEAEAISIANDSAYGLSGAVFTTNAECGLRVARSVRTGTYTVNGFTFNLSAPFGGFKQSGIGREWGPEGLSAFTELKSVSVL